MDSRQFQKEFSEWYPFNEQGVINAPRQRGAYVIRKAGGQRFGRLRGESDILYIGKAETKGGLKQRLQQHMRPGPTQYTNQRIKKLARKYEMEVAWHACEKPRNVEHHLLSKYVSKHDELPPLNHARPKLLYQTITGTARITIRGTKQN